MHLVMATTEIISIIFGLGGLAFGAYSYLARRKSKKKKEKFTALAQKLRDVHSRATYIVEGYSSPLSNEDMAGQLGFTSKSLLAFNHETGQSPRVEAEVIHDDQYIHDGEKALKIYKGANSWVRVNLQIDPGNTSFKSRYKHDVDHHFLYIGTGYQTIDEIRERHGNQVEEFSPNLLDELESTLDKIVTQAFDHLGSVRRGKEFNMKNYQDVDEISLALFEHFWVYEGSEKDIEELSNILSELEKTRSALVQTSYS